jgi:hypothetical protein
MRYFSVAEYVKNGEIVLVWIPTEKMLADILTKALVGHLFIRFRDIIAPRLTYG